MYWLEKPHEQQKPVKEKHTKRTEKGNIISFHGETKEQRDDCGRDFK